ncbi:MAG: GNAT family N-acetyltransferase [Alteromonadales bacterium]|nr:GNAT family N-acetyltransferase [Alteromonadales bacterium]
MREITENDTSKLFQIYSDKNALEHYDVEPLVEMKQAVCWVKEFSERFKNQNGIRWGIEWKDTGEYIGDIGFNYYDHWNLRTEVGFILSPDYWRNGIGTEALNAVIHYGFSTVNSIKLYRIEAETTLTNKPSMALLNRLGFVEEGILREGRKWRDQITDVRLYSFLRSQYEKQDEIKK